MIRIKEVRRVKAANMLAAKLMGMKDEGDTSVDSSRGPYMTTSGRQRRPTCQS